MLRMQERSAIFQNFPRLRRGRSGRGGHGHEGLLRPRGGMLRTPLGPWLALSRGKPTPPSRATAKAEKHRQNPWVAWTAERSPECASLRLLCRTSTSLGACGWPNGCLVLSSVRGLQMNVCRINGAQRLVERSHECPRRSDQTISMHTRSPCRFWMGLSPSIELNNANGKSVHMPRRIAQSPNG